MIAHGALALLMLTIGAGPPAVVTPYDILQLDNGLNVILHEDHAQPRVAVLVRYPAGSGRERRGETGAAHLLEHVLFEGTQHLDDGDFERLIEATGGRKNGATNPDRVVYWEDLPSEALELGIYLESSRMGFSLPALTPEVVDLQRNVVLQERRQRYTDTPYGNVRLRLPSALFPAGHPYDHASIGRVKDLRALDADDLKRFFSRHYGSEGAVMVLAGDIDIAATRALLARYFHDVRRRRGPPPVVAPAVELVGERRLVLVDEVELPMLVVAWPTVPRFHPAEASLTSLASVLGGHPGARLRRRLIRDLQIARSVRVTQLGREAGGMFIVEVQAAPGVELDSVLVEIDAELRSLSWEGPTAGEVAAARRAAHLSVLEGREVVGGTWGRAGWLAEYWALTGNPDYFAQDLARFDALTAADLRAATLRWLAPRRVVISVVPQAQKKALAVRAGRDHRVFPSVPLAKAEDHVALRQAARPRRVPSALKRSVIPEPGAPSRIVLPDINSTRLPGGVTVHHVGRPGTGLIDVMVHISGGAADDPAGAEGIASLAAAWLGKGARGMTSDGFADAVASLGATLKVEASWSAVTVQAHGLASERGPLLDRVGDVLVRPALRADDFDAARAQLETGWLAGLGHMRTLGAQGRAVLMFPTGARYALPKVGTPASRARLSAEGVRSWIEAALRPERTHVTIVGDIDAPEAFALVAQALSGYSRPPSAPLKQADLTGSRPPERRVLLIDRPGASQALVSTVVALGRERRPYEDAALALVDTAIGGSSSSRLNQELRERRGLTYGVRSWLSLRPGSSTLTVSTQVARGKLNEALTELEATLGTTPDALTDADIEKARLLSLRRLQGRFGHGRFAAARVAVASSRGGGADAIKRFARELREVTADEVRAVAREVLSQPRSYAIVLDAEHGPPVTAFGDEVLSTVAYDQLQAAPTP